MFSGWCETLENAEAAGNVAPRPDGSPLDGSLLAD